MALCHLCRLTSWLDGDLLSSIRPYSELLLKSLGNVLAQMHTALAGFDHAAMHRPLLWNMEGASKVLDQYAPLITSDVQRQLIHRFQDIYTTKITLLGPYLKKSAIHNDANDNNVIVNNCGPWEQKVNGLIDFGDMVYSWRVTDVAVACAYAILEQDRPLDVAVQIIRGYHESAALEEAELEVLFAMIGMRLCMSVCICAYQKTIEPDNTYLAVSERPAWQALKALSVIPSQYAHFLFRDACGLPPVPAAPKIIQWLEKQPPFHSVVNLDLSQAPLLLLDASVSSPYIDVGHGDYDPERMTTALFRAIEDAGAQAGIGRYDEYRLIYQSDGFTDFTGHQRTLHIGIDIFQAAGSPVFAPLAGKVLALTNNNAPFDYGGSVILQHDIQGDDGELLTFYTLYGHLSPHSFQHLAVGQPVAPGNKLAEMGEIEANGYWPPHVHFEVITDLLDETDTFFGVGNHDHRNVWLHLCPDPNLILGIPEAVVGQRLSDADRDSALLQGSRNRHLSEALSLSYQSPILMARGAGQYMYDYTGRRYLDAVNNVPHVGHCHPRVVAAQTQAATVLNTNTRYLYPQISYYAEQLLGKFPSPLEVVFFVNSGSEANDLAIRLAWSYTGRKDIVVLDHAYHGNLTALIDLSPYKHDGPGGAGTPGWVRKAIMPDGFRGPFKYGDGDLAEYYGATVARLIHKKEHANPPAAFISESILGCGGQVVLPEGYLKTVYQTMRSVGGLCIADEVQTGFGRVGGHFWAFQTQEVVPDIVTLGKPAGNGHPLAAVVTTKDIAQKFNNGMEYFNTFGGNPVSCAIGSAVLEVIEEEGLQQNARDTGDYLKAGLRELAEPFPLIGEVRGEGLFLGVELITDHHNRTPAARQASYIAERMKQCGVLISTDGPDHNVLKIKPPIVFNHDNANQLIKTLEAILQEPWAQPVESQC